MLPSNSNYVSIVKNIRVFIKDNYLKDGKPIQKKKGVGLISHTGGFSKVFPIYIGNDKIALRFWTKEIGESKERYKEIDIYLKKKKLPYFVNFHYVEDKLIWQGVKYPFVYMDWITGLSIRDYINKYISNPHAIKRLATEFLKMVKILHQNSIAHGDLQDENILVIDNGVDIELKLIDYDSLYVPKLDGFNIDVVGVEAYQHPNKNDIKKINHKIDYFSELVIYLSLLAYFEDTSLWDNTKEKQLLFNRKDFIDPENSKIFQQLKDKKYSSTIHKLRAKLIEFCKETTILRLQPLEKLLPIEFEDRDIKEAYQRFADLSIGDTKEILDEITEFWKSNQDKTNTKSKILNYLYFLTNQEKYLLPNNYQELVADTDFSFIENIYRLYTIDELKKISKKISLDIVDLAKNGSFEEQSNINELHFLNTRILPSDFMLELKKDFFGTVKKIDSYVRKDMLEKTLDRSILSDDKAHEYIKKLQESKSHEYTKNFENMIAEIKKQYILPTDYQNLIIDKSPSLNYIFPNFYDVNEIEKLGEKLSVNNLVGLVRGGSFKEQKTIETLNDVKDKYILPIDFNRALEKDLFKTIKTVDDIYITRDKMDVKIQKSKLSKNECQQQVIRLEKSIVAQYEKIRDKVEHEIDKDPKFEKMFMELKFNKYSETVQEYLNKFLTKKSYLQKDDYKIVELLDTQLKKRRNSRLIYIFMSLSFFMGLFFLSDRATLIFPIGLFFMTLFYFYNINKLDRIPKKNWLKITGKIKPLNRRLFSSKLWIIDIIIILIFIVFGYFTQQIYQVFENVIV